jgi:hypothetical protein
MLRGVQELLEFSVPESKEVEWEPLWRFATPPDYWSVDMQPKSREPQVSSALLHIFAHAPTPKTPHTYCYEYCYEYCQTVAVAHYCSGKMVANTY